MTTQFCPTCAQAKRDHEDWIKNGKLKTTDVGDEKGFDIITKLSLYEAPIFIIELKDGRYIIDE